MKKRNLFIIIIFWITGLIGLTGCATASMEGAPEEPSGIEPTHIPPTQTSASPQPTALPDTPKAALFYERRIISLDWPESIKVGESDRIQLFLEVDQEGKVTPTAISDNGELHFESIFIPDIYESHYLNVEARLDIAGMDILPEGTVSSALIQGKDTIFFWSLSPRQVGSFSGTVWLYLNIIPKGDGLTQKELLLAKPLTIKSVTVFGLPANVARWGGVIGTGFSFIFGIPYFEEIMGWVLKKVKRSYKKV